LGGGSELSLAATQSFARRARKSTIQESRRIAWGIEQSRSCALLTEQEVARSWSQLFKTKKIELVAFDRAEQLLDELRAESPLRLRLTVELEELRRIHADRLSVAVQN
jgi:hypothetical protein